MMLYRQERHDKQLQESQVRRTHGRKGHTDGRPSRWNVLSRAVPFSSHDGVPIVEVYRVCGCVCGCVCECVGKRGHQGQHSRMMNGKYKQCHHPEHPLHLSQLTAAVRPGAALTLLHAHATLLQQALDMLDLLLYTRSWVKPSR